MAARIDATPDSAWMAAFREHEAAVSAFTALVEQVPVELWHKPTAPGKWSPAAVALHIARAYEVGRDALTTGAGMKLLVAPWQAWLARTFLLPLVLVVGRIPKGVDAPEEVVPEASEAAALSPQAAATRIRTAGAAAAAVLMAAARRQPVPHFTHAYFGPLPALTVFRFVSLHTRHHARTLPIVRSPHG